MRREIDAEQQQQQNARDTKREEKRNGTPAAENNIYMTFNEKKMFV